MTTTTVTTVPPATSVATAPAAVGARQRLLFTDHLRAVRTCLVVVHHLAIALAITIPGL